jgi:hypothetical protein
MKAKKRSRQPTQTAKTAQRRATTFRFAPAVLKRLELLGKVKRTPLNRLVNAAVEQYVATSLKEVEEDLTETLDRIKAARVADPDFESAIADVVNAETSFGNQDPVEGQAFTVTPVRRQGIRKGKQTQRGVHEILNA